MILVESKHLFYREGGSDKVYNVELLETPQKQYVVKFAYGRRGSTLSTGTKTASPTTFEKASAVYGKLIHEKMAKGYCEKEGAGVAFSLGTFAPRKTEFLPQLLNDVDESRLEELINSPEWIAQEKMDGVRRGLIRKGTDVIGTNKKGLSVEISDALTGAILMAGTKDFILDGEAIGDTVYVFDMPDPNLTLAERLGALDKLKLDGKILVKVPTAYTPQQKADLYAKILDEKGEGIVFKKIDSMYKSGRPNSGGDQLKFKFVASATCIVTSINTAGTSIGIAVFDENGNPVPVGNTTVYANSDKVKPGDFVEVKYLYYNPGGALFQPVLLGKRDDVGQEDCTLKQLKPKKQVEENV